MVLLVEVIVWFPRESKMYLPFRKQVMHVICAFIYKYFLATFENRTRHMMAIWDMGFHWNMFRARN